MPDIPEILLVLPAYEESVRLPPFLRALCAEISQEGLMNRCAVLVVDDGSSSEEAERMATAVTALRADYPFLAPILRREPNTGKGGAVYGGWQQAVAGTRWLGFVDSDGAVDAEETVRTIRTALDSDDANNSEDSENLSEAPPAAYYAVRTGHEVARTFIRKILGRVFASFVRLLFHFPVSDTQCGMKIVPKDAFDALEDQLQETGFCFDIELTFLLIERGTQVHEIPIRWHESPGSKVRFFSAANMLVTLIALRLRLHRQ